MGQATSVFEDCITSNQSLVFDENYIFKFEGRSSKTLILSSDKIMENNFAKLCTLKSVLLDVFLSFITGCKLVVLFARDRSKKNYITCATF